MLLLKLFWSFFQVGICSVGGGMAAMPIIQSQVVEKQGWLSLTQFTDLITIAEMTPGPIAVNAATFVGIHIAGLSGAIVATIGCIFPSCVIVSLLAWVYFKYRNMSFIKGVLGGLRPAVIALIASAGLKILILGIWGEEATIHNLFTSSHATNVIAICLFGGALFVLRKWKPSPVLVMLGTGFVGGIIYLIPTVFA